MWYQDVINVMESIVQLQLCSEIVKFQSLISGPTLQTKTL